MKSIFHSFLLKMAASMIGFRIIDFIRGTNTVSVFKYLKRIQFLPEKELLKLSWKSLQKLWEESQNVAYYSNFKSYDDLPILTKKEIKKEKDMFLNDKTKKSDRVRKKTGGSTGAPFVFYTSKLSQSYLWAGILLSWDSAGWRPGNKIAILAGSSVVGAKGWKQKIYYRLMNAVTFDSFDMTADKMQRYLKHLQNANIKFIYGYANAIYHLALFNLKQERKVKLKSVISTAENLTSKMRMTIEKSFNCEVFNQYGCNDAGLSAFECSYHQGLHVINTRAYIEVLNNRLISTDTTNNVMPMFRYDSGDRVELSNIPCKCGRGFPLIKEVIGRSNDIVYNLQTGSIIHSEFFNHLFRENKEIDQFQVVVDNDRIKVNLVMNEEFKEDSSFNFYRELISKKTGYDKVLFVTNEALVKSSNGKVKTIINNQTIPS